MNQPKKLQRDTFNKVIGGVCSGLSEYFNIDVTIFRVLFVAFVLCGGFGGGLYIILWIAMPAKSVYDTNNPNLENYNNRTNDSAKENTPMQNNTPENNKQTGLIIGLLFIVAGVFFFLINFYPVANLLRYWPVILIVLGIYIIVNKTKTE